MKIKIDNLLILLNMTCNEVLSYMNQLQPLLVSILNPHTFYKNLDGQPSKVNEFQSFSGLFLLAKFQNITRIFYIYNSPLFFRVKLQAQQGSNSI